MDQIGRILNWSGGIATVEVRRGLDGAGGSCGSCPVAGGGPLLAIPSARARPRGERVKVRSLQGLHQSMRWAGFLVAFSAVLWAVPAFVPEAGQEGISQRWAILSGLLVGGIAWEFLRRWTGKRAQHCLVDLGDHSVPAARPVAKSLPKGNSTPPETLGTISTATFASGPPPAPVLKEDPWKRL